MRLFSHDHDPKTTRVVIAMSGGVDSSVTAALVKEAGYDAVGITLQLYDHGKAISKKGACCAGQDIYDAREVADKLHMPHYVLDYEKNFREAVIDDFADSYLKGETPLPCVRCNQRVKFKDLLQTAHDLGAAALITGHYAQRLGSNMSATLHRAVDVYRDQSYFLFATTTEQLNYLRFPLGGMEKSEVREHAHRFGLKVAEKPDSQDICFVPTGKYAQTIQKLRPDALQPGNILHVDGRILGMHEGIIHYTIGQRRGIKIGGGEEPLYVVAIHADAHEIVVGPKELLGCRGVVLKDMNWLVPLEKLAASSSLMVKYRSTQPPIPATFTMSPEGGIQANFVNPEYGVAPGQACVFYEADQVLGGGWIAETLAAFSHVKPALIKQNIQSVTS